MRKVFAAVVLASTMFACTLYIVDDSTRNGPDAGPGDDHHGRRDAGVVDAGPCCDQDAGHGPIPCDAGAPFNGPVPGDAGYPLDGPLPGDGGAPFDGPLPGDGGYPQPGDAGVPLDGAPPFDGPLPSDGGYPLDSPPYIDDIR
jgi:hypothetical protein